MNLPTAYLRCEGRTARILGHAVLAHEGTHCARRSADRPQGVQFLPVTPKGWPCGSRLDEEDVVEVYGE